MQALILVDIQYDFLPGGALAVPHGDEVIPVAEKLIPLFQLVVATQDYHPPGHLSFASQHSGKQVGETIELEGLEQILWPDHCVQGTRGAELVDQIDPAQLEAIIPKGTNTHIDSYSGFFDNGHKQATKLHAFLENRGVNEVFLLGLATDYCVKFTALDARELGYTTYLIQDGCRGVNLNPGDVDRALEEMQSAGVQLIPSDDVPNLLTNQRES